MSHNLELNASASKIVTEVTADSSVRRQNEIRLISSNNDCDDISISQLTVFEEEWIIKVSILRKGSIETYSNKNGPVEVLKLILCDAEGSKIQATLFKDTIEKFFSLLERGRSYRVRNGKIRAINPQYFNVNAEIELTFTMKTDVEEIEDFIPFSISTLSHVEFSNVSDLVAEGKLLDIIGAVISVKAIFVIKSKGVQKREIILTNGSLETIKLTLWGDMAENEGQYLEENVKGIPMIDAFNIKGSIYEGEVGLSTTKSSYILTNPNIDEVTKIKERISRIKSDNDLHTLLPPSKRMEEARILSLNEIVVGSVEDPFCSFIGKIKKVLNKNNPWFENCNSCNSRVYPNGDKPTAFYRQCNIEDALYIRRYLLKVIVSDGVTEAFITLFDAAESLVGCGVVEYAKEVLTDHKERSVYYRNLVLIEDKEFKFLVRMDQKGRSDRAKKQIVVQEVHKAIGGARKLNEVLSHEFEKNKKIKLEK